MTILSKAIYRFSVITIKIPTAVFKEIKKNNNPKMYMKACFESPLAEEFKSKLEINEGSLKIFENNVTMRLISTINCKKRYSVK